MATYKVTIPVTLVVEINETNQTAGPKPMLHGDSPIIAVRRAIDCLMSSPIEKRKELGVRRLFITGAWDKFPVETFVDGARITGHDVQKPSPSTDPTATKPTSDA